MGEKKRYFRIGLFLVLTAAILMSAGCQNRQERKEQQKFQQGIQQEPQQGIQGETGQEAFVPVVSVDSRETEEYTGDGKQLLVSGTCELPVVLPAKNQEVPKALQTALKDWCAEQEEDFWETAEQYKEDAMGYCEIREASGGLEGEFYGCSIESRIVYTRVDAAVLSFCQNYSDYDCGPHGNYWYEGVTFRVKDGKRLELKDLLKEDADFSEFCTRAGDYCIQAVKEGYREELYENYETIIRESFEEEGNWYLDAAGIMMIYDPYEIGSYAMGPVFVTLPYEEFADLLKPEYRDFAGEGTAELPLDTEAEIELTQDTGERVRLWIEETQIDDVWDFDLWIQVGEQKEKMDDMARIGSAYILRRQDGRIFLLFDADMASDDYITYLYEITDGILRKTGETDRICSIEPGYVNPGELKLRTRVELLGTYSAKVDYQITEDGELFSDCSYYELENRSPWAVLTTTRELPVAIDGRDTSLPAGSRIRIIAADEEGTAWFREEGSGTEGEIHCTRGNEEGSRWPICIDGVEDSEYFEFLPYAG